MPTNINFPDLERFTEILDELANELPEEFYRELNGGVVIIEYPKPHPKANDGRLFVLGEYIVSHDMGRYIAIYYGSFERLFPDYSEAQLTDELRRTLRHEFRHHLETLAGERTLAIEDEERLKRYMSSQREVFKIKRRYKYFGDENN